MSNVPPAINDPKITYIIVNVDRVLATIIPHRKGSVRFVFDWSMKHYRLHKNELDYVPNVYYFHLKEWIEISNILTGTDSLSHALLYMNPMRGEHIPLIAKLIVTYGIESVKLVDINLKTLIL